VDIILEIVSITSSYTSSVFIPETGAELAPGQLTATLCTHFPSYPEMGEEVNTANHLDTFPHYANIIYYDSRYSIIMLQSYD
jgi:hypothetical protein